MSYVPERSNPAEGYTETPSPFQPSIMVHPPMFTRPIGFVWPEPPAQPKPRKRKKRKS